MIRKALTSAPGTATYTKEPSPELEALVNKMAETAYNQWKPKRLSAHECYKKARKDNLTHAEYKELLIENGIITKKVEK